MWAMTTQGCKPTFRNLIMLQFDPAYIDMALSSWLDAIHLDFRAGLGLDEFTVLYHISQLNQTKSISNS